MSTAAEDARAWLQGAAGDLIAEYVRLIDDSPRRVWTTLPVLGDATLSMVPIETLLPLTEEIGRRLVAGLEDRSSRAIPRTLPYLRRLAAWCSLLGRVICRKGGDAPALERAGAAVLAEIRRQEEMPPSARAKSAGTSKRKRSTRGRRAKSRKRATKKPRRPAARSPRS